MTSKRTKKRRKSSVKKLVKVTTKAYKEREQTCSYKDYLELITLAAFNQHQVRHLHVDKFKTNNQIEIELLKRWNKLPLEERNKYQNEAIDNDIFHQIAYLRMYSNESFDDKSSTAPHSIVQKELESQWNDLPDEEKIVHKKVVTNRDIEMRRFF